MSSGRPRRNNTGNNDPSISQFTTEQFSTTMPTFITQVSAIFETIGRGITEARKMTPIMYLETTIGWETTTEKMEGKDGSSH